MFSSATRALFGLVAMSLVSLGQAQPSSSVSGTVLRLGTSESLSNTLVSLTSEAGITIDAKTDTGGRFEFRTQPGSYVLEAVRPGFLRPTGAVGPIRVTLELDQRLSDLRISLQPMAVLRGQVLDENGRPKYPADVMLLRPSREARREQITTCDSQVRSTQTDREGNYYLEAPAGRYYLAVSPNRCKEQPQYYPNADDIANATQVPLLGGEQVISFRLSPRDTYAVTFRVSPAPKTLRRAYMLVTRLSRNNLETIELELVVPSPNEVPADGTFHIPRLLPGDYDIAFTPDVHTVSRVHFPVRIANRDIDVGVVQIPPSITLSGTFMAAREAALAAPRVRTITMRPAEGRLATLTTPLNLRVVVGEDGRFSVPDFPQGKYRLVLTGIPANGYLSSVYFGQTEITDPILDLNGSKALNLTYDGPGGNLEGVISDNVAKPIPHAQILVIPAPKHRGNPSRYREETADQNGRFAVRGLPAGEYKIFGWQTLELGGYLEPGFIEKIESRGTVVTISPGTSVTANVRALPSVQ